MKKEGIHPDSPDWSHNGLVLAKKIVFEFEDLKKSIHPDSPDRSHNGVGLTKKFVYDSEDLEKGIYPGSPEIGTHNEEGLLPSFVLPKILPAIFPSSEDAYSSEDEDLKRDWFAQRGKILSHFRRRVCPAFCKDEKVLT